MDALLNSIEKVKNKLTDKQYKKIMDQLGEIHKQIQPMKKLTIIFVKFGKEQDDDMDITIAEPELVQFIQPIENDPDWDAQPKRDGFVDVPICHLNHILTAENFHTLLMLCDSSDDFVRSQTFKLKIEDNIS